jgi:hypothetical protein
MSAPAIDQEPCLFAKEACGRRDKRGGVTMTDHEHADAIRKCIGELHKAVRAARKAGLYGRAGFGEHYRARRGSRV